MREYSIESLLHLGNPTVEQRNILQHMLKHVYTACKVLSNGTRKYYRYIPK